MMRVISICQPLRTLVSALLSCMLAATTALGDDSSTREARQRMVIEQIAARGVRDDTVLSAMRTVPRQDFIPSSSQKYAYRDAPLPIGYGQTISQPYIVGLMTEMLELSDGDRVLEVGTGSGYQAAILSRITRDVFTIEIVWQLHQRVLPLLARYGLDAKRVIHGDGYFGLEQSAPFDAIIVTAAADHIPPPLIEQLKPDGRMVIPVGPVHGAQRLILVEKDANGQVRTESVLPVRFVPLTRAD